MVEPDYYSPFPPLGLLKLSTYEKNRGNTTELVRKNGLPQKRPDKIYVTSLFTWAWKPVWEAVRRFKAIYPEVELSLGGLYASLLPQHAKWSGADHVHIGLHPQAEDHIPDYSLVPEWNGSIVFASRGCPNNCPNCVVPKLEGKICNEKKSIKKYVMKEHTKIYFFDNNILAMNYWEDIFQEVIDLNKIVDFNQGLEAKLLNDHAAELISKMRIPLIRLAYDNPHQKNYVKKAIDLLHSHGLSKRNILVYAMFNFTETPNEYFERVREILNWGSVCYPMRFQPVVAINKDKYISPYWTEKYLDMVASARRVIGFGGAFPPYKGLVEKFNNAKNFYEAFKLYPVEKKTNIKLKI
ncbi:MAG: hypothetical protein ACTSQY_05025 [Candidatus Odinarchaeia archaeon]